MEKRKLGRPLKGSSRRVATTIYIPMDMLMKIDEISDNRSEYVVDAIAAKMEEESENDNTQEW